MPPKASIFCEVVFGFLLDAVGGGFDEVAAGEGIDGLGDAGFVGDDLLGAEGDAGGLFGGEGEGFVVAVGVERLGAAEDGGHGLDGGAGDVVLGLLGGEGGAGGLGVEAEHPGARIFCVEALAHDAGPEAAGGAELGDLFDEVVVRVEEEREARGEGVDVETRRRWRPGRRSCRWRG